MKLQYIKYEKYNINLKTILKNSKTKYINRQGLIIHIKSNQFTGKGEAAPLQGFSKENLQDVIWALESFIKSIEFSLNYNFIEIIELIKIHCQNIPSLHFALDTAIYDIKAQQNKCSISEILNPNYNNEVYFSDIYINNESKINSNHLKYKLGIRDISEDIEILNTIHRKKPLINFRFDANQIFSVTEFQKIYKKLAHLNVEYFEEPVSMPSINKLSEIQYAALALDESLYNHKVEEWFKKKLIKFAIIKPSIFGGYDQILSFIKKCKKNKVKIIVSSALESTIGNMASIQIAAILNNQLYHGLNIHNFYNQFEIMPKYNENQTVFNLKNTIGLGF